MSVSTLCFLRESSGQQHSCCTEEVIHFLQLYTADWSFVTEDTTQGSVWAAGVAFFWQDEIQQSEGKKILMGIFEGVKKDMKQMLFVAASVAIRW